MFIDSGCLQQTNATDLTLFERYVASAAQAQDAEPRHLQRQAQATGRDDSGLISNERMINEIVASRQQVL